MIYIYIYICIYMHLLKMIVWKFCIRSVLENEFFSFCTENHSRIFFMVIDIIQLKDGFPDVVVKSAQYQNSIGAFFENQIMHIKPQPKLVKYRLRKVISKPMMSKIGRKSLLSVVKSFSKLFSFGERQLKLGAKLVVFNPRR